MRTDRHRSPCYALTSCTVCSENRREQLFLKRAGNIVPADESCLLCMSHTGGARYIGNICTTLRNDLFEDGTVARFRRLWGLYNSRSYHQCFFFLVYVTDGPLTCFLFVLSGDHLAEYSRTHCQMVK